MDEYLNDDDTPVDPESSLSFVGYMERNVYSQIKPELLMPKEQRLFPMPGKEAELDARLFLYAKYPQYPCFLRSFCVKKGVFDFFAYII